MADPSELRVIKVLSGGRAIVSTSGLFRAVTADGKILSELEPRWLAEVMVDTWNRLHGPGAARIEAYRATKPRRRQRAACSR